MLARWEQDVTDGAGNRIDQPTIRVEREVPGLPLAVLKADKNASASLSNPFTPASGVTPFFYTAGGFFKITITKGAYSKVLRDVAIGTAAGMDAPPLNPGGVWDSGTAYSPGQVVQHAGSSYWALAESTAVEPGVTGGWESSWSLLAQAGTDGEDGVDGAAVPGPGLAFPEQSSDPSTPAAGTLTVYAKDDHKLYTKDSAGTVTEIGAGAAPGASTLSTYLLALATSDALNNPVYLGDAVADNFDTLGLVDTAGATNLTTSEAGYLKNLLTIGSSDEMPTMSAPTTSGVTVTTSADNGGLYPGWKAFDASLGDLDCWAPVWTGGPEWMQIDFGSGNAKRLGRYKIAPRTASGTAYICTAWTFRGSNDGSNWTTLDTRSGVTSGWTNGTLRTFDIPEANVDAYRYYELNVTGCAGNPLIVGEMELIAATVPNVTVASQALPFSISPTKLAVTAAVIPINAITLNTDLIFEVSRDAGSNWVAVTLSLAMTIGSVHILTSDFVDVSAQTLSTCKWRLRSLNGKLFKCDGVVASAQA